MNATDIVALLPPGPGTVAVSGDGALAVALRAQLGPRAADASQAPAAAIDTTGDPAVIGELIVRVADLGTIVLAGPPPEQDLELDLYPQVHLRGLTLTAARRG